MHARPGRILAASTALGVLLAAGTFLAHAALGGTAGVTIPYSGRLEFNGTPVNGLATFRVDLFNAPVGGSVCHTQTISNVTVAQGAFGLVVSGVPEGCVRGRDVYLSISVDQGAGPVALGGRQRVHPAVAALTSGAGDLDVGGEMRSASVVTGAITASGAVNSAGSVASNTGETSVVLGEVGHGNAYRGLARGNHATASNYALIQGTSGDTHLNSAPGQPVRLRVGNADRVTVGANGGMDVVGGISASGTGGNVPNRCVVRTATNTYNVSCAAGEIAVGGGGRCNSLWRLTESHPWNVGADAPYSSDPQATGWRAVCQVWGNAGSYAFPQLGVYAICCRQ